MLCPFSKVMSFHLRIITLSIYFVFLKVGILVLIDELSCFLQSQCKLLLGLLLSQERRSVSAALNFGRLSKLTFLELALLTYTCIATLLNGLNSHSTVSFLFCLVILDSASLISDQLLNWIPITLVAVTSNITNIVGACLSCFEWGCMIRLHQD